MAFEYTRQLRLRRNWRVYKTKPIGLYILFCWAVGHFVSIFLDFAYGLTQKKRPIYPPTMANMQIYQIWLSPSGTRYPNRNFKQNKPPLTFLKAKLALHFNR